MSTTLTLSPEIIEVLPPILTTVGVVILGLLLVVTIRGRIGRRQANQPPPQVEGEHSDAGGTRDDLSEERLIEFLSTARQLVARMDDRTARLEHLIELADERLALLSAELAETSDFDTVDAPNESRSGGASSEASAVAAVVRSAPPNRSSASPGTSDALAKSVFELADGGHSPVEIARRLQEHTGKIELILALRRQAC